MNLSKHKSGAIGKFTALIIVVALILMGPAEAVLVSLSQPNDANKGSDVSFSTSVEVKDSDLLPIKYTDLVLTGPDGFSKTCRINLDGTDNCDDVVVTISKSSISLTEGAQYGYDQNLGYGYNLGTGYGYSSITTGTITYAIVWHTSSTLADGTYNADVDVYSEGSSDSHTFSSSSKSFTISTASSPSGGGGGGEREHISGLMYMSPEVELVTTTPVVIEEVSEASETPTETESAGMEGITGAAVTEVEGKTLLGLPRMPAIAGITIVGLLIAYLVIWSIFFKPSV